MNSAQQDVTLFQCLPNTCTVPMLTCYLHCSSVYPIFALFQCLQGIDIAVVQHKGRFADGFPRFAIHAMRALLVLYSALLVELYTALLCSSSSTIHCCRRNNWCAKTCPLITGWRGVTQIQKYTNVNQCTSTEIQMHKHRCTKTKPELQKKMIC